MTHIPSSVDDASYKEVLRKHFDTYARGWHQRMLNHVYAMRFRAVERMIRPLQVSSVLDVGCGTGDYARLFDALKVDYLGIDISERMIDECRRLFPGYKFEVVDGDAIAVPPAAYDLVLDIGVLEYQTNPPAHLRELARVTKPGGSIIATVQNGNNISRRFDRPVRAMLDSAPGKALRRALGRPVDAPKRTADGSAKDPRVLHHRWTVPELQDMGAQIGLDLVDSAHVSLYLLPELIPGLAAVNDRLSRLLSLKRGMTWLQRPTALVLVGRWQKRVPIAGTKSVESR